jgi:DNA (cytosine-5)-methyltransferase 1
MFFGLPQNRQRVVIVGTKMTDVTKARVSLASNYDLANVSSNDFYGLQEYDKWRYLSSHRKKFPTWGVCFKDRFYCCDVDTFEQANPIPTLSEILESSPPDEFFMDKTTKVRLQSSVFINRLVGGVHILYNQSGGARMGYTVFGTDGIAPTLTASHSRHYERYKVGKRYRRLTNKEYARLQGFSDAHCAAASVFKQYGLYGNAVPPPLVEWVISQLIFERGCMLRELEPVKNSQMSRCL